MLASGAGPHESKGDSQEHSEVRKKKDVGKTMGTTKQSLIGRGSTANCGPHTASKGCGALNPKPVAEHL